ncbi:iron transporter [Streptomyces sp. CB01635]|uniref:IucA/IucC family protein n=1 Tax=unclassified Streptomyces TaxID=2593676 RepID=UPI000C273E6E|nr:IucA/IucC family protein [Streptomyces sp. CB01635]PJN13079.1 iron transporter [Streptomyces sp. CB01635]
MNATPAPDDRHRPQASGACDTQPQLAPECGTTVPRQKDGSQEAEHLHGSTADLLEHPDPGTAAQAAAVENLLRCWVRENDLAEPPHGTLRIPLPASGTALLIPVHHWSVTGWHRFGMPHLQDGPLDAPRVDAVTVAALLSREASGPGSAPAVRGGVPARDAGGSGADVAARVGVVPGPAHTPDTTSGTHAGPEPVNGPAPTASSPTPSVPARTQAVPEAVAAASASMAPHPETQSPHPEPSRPTTPHHSHPTPSGDGADLVGRVADSVRRTADFIAHRRSNPRDTTDLFLAAEQSLLLGHPLHPTPKSREGLSEAESRLYSPELQGSFPVHWMAVNRSVLAMDSAWTQRGRPLPADQLALQLAGTELPLPDGHAALPLHPWQVRELKHRPQAAALLDAGLLRDLGPHGAPWYPTSSVRTLYQPDASAMLKLSLGLRITNSRRENLRKELHRGVEVHRLLRTGLFEQWQAAHPGFDIVRDPAWLAVNGPDGEPVPGLDVMIRNNPFAPGDDAACIAGFVSPRPPALAHGQRDRQLMRSRLAETITRLAGRTGRPRGAVAAEWFLRYLEHVVRPVLWLDSTAGVALEAHQQNTLLLLDPEGWPVGGRYRDNQGYYFRESRRAELDGRLPGIGSHSDTFVSDDVTDERFAYYLGINNIFGLIGAFGSQQLADERLLLAAFRGFLSDVASGPDKLRTPLPRYLLDSPALRCKANLLTRLHGLDELVGPVDTQSVYVTIANPLHS